MACFQGRLGDLCTGFSKNLLGCNIIIGTSFWVPIKRRAVEAICAATPVGKGKEKRIKQEKLKEAKVEESAEGTKAGPEAKQKKKKKKKRKTGKS